MKKLNLIILLLILTCLWSCENSTEPELNNLDSVPKENLVAFTAVFATPDGIGWWSQKIVIADYYNPSNYKIVTDTPSVAVEATFSRNKNLLLFGDEKPFVHDRRLFLYNINNKSTELLYEAGHEDGLPLLGTNAIWNYYDSGFYYGLETGGSILFFDLNERLVSRHSVLTATVGLKGKDTLIVWSINTNETGGKLGFYFMDLEGNYLSRINNPYLEMINWNGVTKKGAYSPSWNDELNLFVYAEIDSTVKGYKISVTDLTGNYYRNYTPGDYIDDHPVWGPNGETILFDRRNIRDDYWTQYKLMKINCNTGEVKEYIDPSIINGVAALRLPDF